MTVTDRDEAVQMRWRTMSGVPLLFTCFALFFGALQLGFIGSESPARLERTGRLLAVPMLLVSVGFVANALHMMARSPIRLSKERLYLPGYWRRDKREIPWTAVKTTRIRPLPHGAAELMLKLRDGSSRRVPLAFVQNPGSFRLEVEARTQATNREDDIW